MMMSAEGARGVKDFKLVITVILILGRGAKSILEQAPKPGMERPVDVKHVPFAVTGRAAGRSVNLLHPRDALDCPTPRSVSCDSPCRQG